MSRSKTVGCAVITHRSKHHLKHCLPPLLRSSLKPRVLVVNSSSFDGTVEEAKALGAETLVIPRTDFNHGTTRELARKQLNTDIAVMITPDAYFESEMALETLVKPIKENKASVAYARQIPHHGADFFETFARAFNYPEQSQLRSFDDISKYGVYTFFCSDSAAAYSNHALDHVGGFPSVLLGEDTVAVAKLLRQGHKIAYVAEALVRHSHRYSLKEEFCRNFDIGLARKSYGQLLECKDTKRGVEYVKTMLQCLFKEAPHKIPYAFLHIAAKWFGYQIGRSSSDAPLWFKKRLSTQDFYWK